MSETYEVKLRAQQTIAETRQKKVPVVERHANALLAFVATKARAEQRALAKRDRVTKLGPLEYLRNENMLGWIDFSDVDPTNTIASSHFEGLEEAQAEEIAKLEKLVLGVNIIAKLTTKLGITPAELRDMDVQAIAKHVSLEAAMATKAAFANTDVKLIADGGTGKFSWERGALYANPDHLTTTIEELGLRMQEYVKSARDYYAKGGAVDTAFEAAEAGRQVARAPIDKAISYFKGQDGIVSQYVQAQLAGPALVADVALSPLTMISENVEPQETAVATMEFLGGAAGIGRRASRKFGERLSKLKVEKQRRVLDRADTVLVRTPAREAVTDVFQVPAYVRKPPPSVRPDTITRTLERPVVKKKRIPNTITQTIERPVAIPKPKPKPKPKLKAKPKPTPEPKVMPPPEPPPAPSAASGPGIPLIDEGQHSGPGLPIGLFRPPYVDGASKLPVMPGTPSHWIKC